MVVEADVVTQRGGGGSNTFYMSFNFKDIAFEDVIEDEFDSVVTAWTFLTLIHSSTSA
jgi:hypothetical protein